MIRSMKQLFEGSSSSVGREVELKASFEREWKKKLGKVELQMRESVMTDGAVQERINALFIDQVTDQKEKPVYAGVDPFVKLIDKDTKDNIRKL